MPRESSRCSLSAKKKKRLHDKKICKFNIRFTHLKINSFICKLPPDICFYINIENLNLHKKSDQSFTKSICTLRRVSAVRCVGAYGADATIHLDNPLRT